MKLQHFTMITESLQITDIKQNIVNIGQKQESENKKDRRDAHQ